jgi:cation transport ATPase
VALGQDSDVTAEAAGAVVLDESLRRVDELFHIGRSMRRIALQSAVGGMVLSVAGMALAAAGHLPPLQARSARRRSTCAPYSTPCAPRSRQGG